jgi:hypothetical protein
MKNIIYFLFIITLISSCGEDYKANYDQKLKDFKDNKQELISEKYNRILSLKTKFDEVDDVVPEANHKDIKIEFEDPSESNKFNAVYFDYSFYDDSFPFKLSNQENINDIKNLIEDKELSIYDEASAVLSSEYLNDFIKYGDQFLEVEYVVIHAPLEFVMPEYDDNDTYTIGEVTGLVCVFDLSSQKLLDNFLYVAESSEAIDYVEDVEVSTQDVLMSDFFSNINSLINRELTERYQIEETSFIPLLKENN